MAWVRRLWWQAWVGYGLGAVAFLGAVVLAVWGQGWYAGLTAVFGLLAAAAGAQRECRRKLVELAGGRPPKRMGEVTVAEAGVNPQDDRFRDLYVERDAEPEVCRLLAEHGRVLVVGESMTGKTRMLLHIAGERFPERWCLSPRGADALARLGALRCVPGEVVLWLDELHEFGDPDFVVALEAWRARGAVVFASLRVAEERRIRDTGEFKDPRVRTLDWFASATVRPAVWSATEVGRLRERCPELAGEVGEASLPASGGRAEAGGEAAPSHR
ncbi:hypothetical protein EII42_12120 [Tessaracoccus sp. OH4464_COT-324]|nr:hypothetical protein EII42_12120 [Tessaracoccus sp. OH4464_COT-324]